MTTRCIRLQARLERRAEHVELLRARDDLRLAANRTMTLIHTRGALNGEPLHTTAYRAVSGIRGEEATYEPTTTQPIAGGCRSAVATLVYQRYREDRGKIRRGEKSLATFRRLPLLFRRQEVGVLSHEALELLVWGRAPGHPPRRLTFAVRPAGSRHRAVWRAVVAGTLRYGDARLQLDRLGRWYVLLSHEVLTPEARATGGVLGVELGADRFAVAAHLSALGELEDTEVFPSPLNFWRHWQQDLRIRREIGRANRKDYGLRAGKGRGRKLRPLEKRRARYEARIVDACRVVAHAIVRYAIEHGCRAVAVPNLRTAAKRQQDATEDVQPRETRADIRSRFLRRNRGRLRDAIAAKCEEHGIELLEVSSAKRYSECGWCGEIVEPEAGQVVCRNTECRHVGKPADAGANTALVIARRGLEKIQQEVQE